MASSKTTGIDEISPDLTRHCKATLLLLLHSAARLQGSKDHNPQQELQQLQRHLLSHHRRKSICLDHLGLPTDHDHLSGNEERPPSYRRHHRLSSIPWVQILPTGSLRDRMEDQPRMTVKKMAVYKSCVISTLLYSRQTWVTPYRRQDSTLSTSEASSHLGAQIWRDKVSDIKVLFRVGLSSIYTPYSDYAV